MGPAFIPGTPSVRGASLDPRVRVCHRRPSGARMALSVPPRAPKLTPSSHPPSSAREITSATHLEALLAASDKLAVLEVYSNGCRPCIGFARAFEKVVVAHAHHAFFMKLNSDDVPELARKLGVRSLPTFILFRRGKRVDHFSSAKRETLEMFIEDNV